MDAARFDAFARALALAVPRRIALGGLLGTGLAALLGRFESEDAAAKKKRRKKRKRKKCRGGKEKCGKRCIAKTACCGGCGDEEKCCNGACIPQTDCCGNDDCPIDAPCVDGVCNCPTAGEAACGDTCVNLATDVNNCGGCGIVCEKDFCFNGACECLGVSECPFNGCICGGRKQGLSACFDGSGVQPCDEDSDCPLGSFCLVADRCSVPCLG